MIFVSGLTEQLQEVTVVLLGQKTVGKSASGNILLGKEVFAPCANKQCQVATVQVADRVVTVIDSPGWWKTSAPCNEEMDREIVRGASLSPSGCMLFCWSFLWTWHSEKLTRSSWRNK